MENLIRTMTEPKRLMALGFVFLALAVLGAVVAWGLTPAIQSLITTNPLLGYGFIAFSVIRELKGLVLAINNLIRG